jgi:hypothetical protein
MPLDFAKEAIQNAEKNSINFDELKLVKLILRFLAVAVVVLTCYMVI